MSVESIKLISNEFGSTITSLHVSRLLNFICHIDGEEATMKVNDLFVKYYKTSTLDVLKRIMTYGLIYQLLVYTDCNLVVSSEAENVTSNI